MCKQRYWGERSLYYSSRFISEQLESSQSADRLQLAPTALKNWVDLFEHWQEQHIMAQLTHTPVMTVLQSLEQMSQTKEERIRALARERAMWDYNTDIITA